VDKSSLESCIAYPEFLDGTVWLECRLVDYRNLSQQSDPPAIGNIGLPIAPQQPALSVRLAARP